MERRAFLFSLAALAATGWAVTATDAAEIRDRAGLFSASAVKKAEAALERLERNTRIPVVIETIESIPDLPPGAGSKEKGQAVEQLAEKRAGELGQVGVYLLISRRDQVFSKVLVRDAFASRLPRAQRLKIRDALLGEFKAQRFDEGLASITSLLDQSLSVAHAPPVRAAADPLLPNRANAQGAKFGLGTLLLIGLGIFAVLVVLRGLGNLSRRGADYPAQMGMGGPRPGMGPGMGPGFGQPGYGYGAPRGGGFFSGMLGGLGGAIAGNWLYDQFSGRHSGGFHHDASSYTPGSPSSPESGGFQGGDDYNGGGTSWEDSGGTPGGDWGGSDGGGDWGGGGGGGDWGGGGDGGGW